MDSQCTPSDIVYFEYLLALATTDAANPSSSKPEPFRTYNTAHITPLLPNPSTKFNPFDPIFNVDFLPSWNPTFGHQGEPLVYSTNPCTLEAPMIPMTFYDEPPFDFYPTLPLPPATPSNKVVRKRRHKRSALGLHYSTFQERFDTLTGDPYVLEIYPDDNKIVCSACRKVVQLDNRKPRTLHIQNWDTHKRRCKKVNAHLEAKRRNELFTLLA